MSLGQHIKNNLALTAGIVLPVLMVAGFLLVSRIGVWLNDPPRHIAYFAMENVDYNSGKVDPRTARLEVGKDGAVTMKVTSRKDNGNYDRGLHRDILVAYDAAHDTLTETEIKIPDDMTEGSIAVAEVKGPLVNGGTAPDGYEVTFGSSGRVGFVGDIFAPYSPSEYRLKKNGAVYKLPTKKSYRSGMWSYSYYNGYNQLRFLGWSQAPAAEVTK